MKKLHLLFLVCISAFLFNSVAAQETKPTENKSSAFILDKTTAEQAIQTLGKPDSDKTGKLDILLVDDWVDKKFKKEECRILIFNSFEDLGKVKLAFLADKLTTITFIIKKDVNAAQISATYKIPMLPIFNDFGVKENIGEFEKQSKNVSVTYYPSDFYLLGTSRTSVLAAKVFNGSAPPSNSKKGVQRDPEYVYGVEQLKGKVSELQILSRAIMK